MLSLLIWLLLIIVLYVVVAIGIVCYGERVYLPLGASTGDKIWFWTKHRRENTKLLLYLQGNVEIPEKNVTIRFFMNRKYDVLSVGYTDSLVSSEDSIREVLKRYLTRYSEMGIVARSIGSTLDIDSFISLHQTPKFVIYLTPISSLRKVAEWHLPPLKAFSWFIPGGDRGLNQRPLRNNEYVICSENDEVTPMHLLDARDNVYVVPGADHNTFEVSPIYMRILNQIYISIDPNAEYGGDDVEYYAGADAADAADAAGANVGAK